MGFSRRQLRPYQLSVEVDANKRAKSTDIFNVDVDLHPLRPLDLWKTVWSVKAPPPVSRLLQTV
jgi:hypothetical protein